MTLSADKVGSLLDKLTRYQTFFSRMGGLRWHRDYILNKKSLCLTLFQWFDIPDELRQRLSSAILEGWIPPKHGKFMSEVPGALEDLQDLQAGIEDLIGDPQEPDSWLLQLDTLRYMSVGHILHSRDIKPDHIGAINDLLQEVDDYLLDRIPDPD